MRLIKVISFLLFAVIFSFNGDAQTRITQSFNEDWNFYLGDASGADLMDYDDAAWRKLNVPHDWSIELPFDKNSPTGTGGGALRGGTGWYRKSFTLPLTDKSKKIFIRFDGVYCNSEVFINGQSLGRRPNGYISFQYDLSPYLKFGTEKNILAVKVDNSLQPNSRWYSGSGIYRNTWLLKTSASYIDAAQTFVSSPQVSVSSATIKVQSSIHSTMKPGTLSLQYLVYNAKNRLVVQKTKKINEEAVADITMQVSNPALWSIETPSQYRLVTRLLAAGKIIDETSTKFGIRSFEFNVDKGFFLNGKRVKIRGVCNHHDLGCLGTAVNKSAMRRQLEILKEMGCNGIRTSHNPPAPELLDLCDEMGFIVMNETFDMWKKSKTKYDYSIYWDEWHQRDLEDHIIRDRNHPSVFMWSVGNEIGEQWPKDNDSSGKTILRELMSIVRRLDPTRPGVTANNEINPWNQLLQADATELIGYNYNHPKWDSVFQRWGRKPFIVTESVSALQTRGHYDMPSDSFRIWPTRWDLPLLTGNADTTCSAYDNCHAPWGSSHEATLSMFEKHDHVSGMFVWTGFDYLGEPTPYAWPARSSYFGIIDLAGFPKDVFYLYQSAWVSKPVLHIFPHWNWKPGQLIDVWAYYNNADEVELFVNGVSAGIRKKQGDEMHVFWRLTYQPGTVKAVSRKNGKVVLTKEIRTAGPASRIVVETDHRKLKEKDDLAFMNIKIVDKDGNMVPDASHLVQFKVTGGTVVGVDNGSQTSMESFQGNQRHAFNGRCLAVVKPDKQAGVLQFTASAPGLISATINVAHH